MCSNQDSENATRQGDSQQRHVHFDIITHYSQPQPNSVKLKHDVIRKPKVQIIVQCRHAEDGVMATGNMHTSAYFGTGHVVLRTDIQTKTHTDSMYVYMYVQVLTYLKKPHVQTSWGFVLVTRSLLGQSSKAVFSILRQLTT